MKDSEKSSTMHKNATSKNVTTSSVVCIDFLKYLFFIVITSFLYIFIVSLLLLLVNTYCTLPTPTT